MSAQSIGGWLNKHFVWVLLSAAIAGLIVPGAGDVPPNVLIGIMAGQVFLSSFKITLSDIRDIHLPRVVTFYVLRFILLPIAWGCLLFFWSDDYAIAIFMLILLPAGVSAPAIANILGANISLTILLVVISSVTAPFVIPLMFEWFTAQTVEIDTWTMFVTLFVMVIVPIVLHLPVRKWNDAVETINQYSTTIVIPLVALTVVIAVGNNRDYLLQHWLLPLVTFLMGFVVFLLFYIVAWMFSYKESKPNRMAYALSSGLNNVTMGVVLGLLYFSEEVAIFMVAGNIAWLSALVVFRSWHSRLSYS